MIILGWDQNQESNGDVKTQIENNNEDVNTQLENSLCGTEEDAKKSNQSRRDDDRNTVVHEDINSQNDNILSVTEKDSAKKVK